MDYCFLDTELQRGIKFQKVVGYPYDVRPGIIVANRFCKLGMIIDYFSPLVACIVPSSTMRDSE